MTDEKHPKKQKDSRFAGINICECCGCRFLTTNPETRECDDCDVYGHAPPGSSRRGGNH